MVPCSRKVFQQVSVGIYRFVESDFADLPRFNWDQLYNLPDAAVTQRNSLPASSAPPKKSAPPQHGQWTVPLTPRGSVGASMP